jgi:prophage regulatory protein
MAMPLNPLFPLDPTLVYSRGAAPRLYDRKLLAALLKVSIRTVDRLDSGGKLPPPVRIGGAKRWRKTDIDQWLRLGCPSREEMAAPREGRK